MLLLSQLILPHHRFMNISHILVIMKQMIREFGNRLQTENSMIKREMILQLNSQIV